jgi:TldD protein
MLDRLRGMLAEVHADYADIRYERMRTTSADFANDRLKSVDSVSTDGFVVRVLRNDGFASATATRREDVPEALRLAADGARVMGGSGKKVFLAEAPACNDDVEPVLNMDPAAVPLKEKLDLASGYSRLMLEMPDIAATNVSYSEVDRNKFFVSTRGAGIRERVVTVAIGGEAVAERGGLLQNIRVAVGGADGFHSLLGREQEFKRRAELASALLDAEPLKAGTYDVVLNSSMTGVFAHEAFGHFSEADIIEDNSSMRAKMALGAELGSGSVNIVADSTLPGQVGFYRYDDEGVPVRRVQLMRKGVLTGRLHSLRTAGEFGEGVTGHSVAEDYRYEPIVRMGTIFFEPGTCSLDALLNRLGDGLFLCDAKGGQTAGENFTFGAQYGYMIKGGKKGPMIRDINIMGNLFSTLRNIQAAADDFKLSERGGCGKGQMNIKSGHGGPSILIRGMVVGGV